MILKRLLTHKLAVVLVMAVVARAVVWLAFPDIFGFEQTGAIHGSDAYDRYARNLLATGVYGKDAPGVPDAHIPPLYSYVLAGVYQVFGRGALQIAVLHTVFDALSIALLYHIAKRLLPHGEMVGALSGLFYALYPYLIFQNLTLIDTPLFMTLMHAFVLLVVLLRQRPRLDRGTLGLAVLAGLVLGLSALSRAILPFFAVLVGLWYVFRLSWWQTLARLLPVALVTLVVLVPWTLRNYSIFGTFVPVSLNTGDNFYQGNSPYTIPFFRAGYDVQWAPLEDPEFDQIQDLFGPEANNRRFAVSLQFLRENAHLIPELLWVKFWVHWSIDIAPRLNPQEGQLIRLDADNNVIIITDSGEALPVGDPVSAYSTPLFDQLGRLVHVLYFGSLLLLALVGVYLTWRQWREVSLLWFMQISMTIVYVIFHPSTRYRAPSDPLLFVFSAYALVYLLQKTRAGRVIMQDTSAVSET